MKKILFSLLFLMTIFLFCSCQTTYWYFDYEQLKQDVAKAEICYKGKSETGESQLEVLKVLNEEEMDRLIYGLSCLTFEYKKDVTHNSGPYYSNFVRLTYHNGVIYIISLAGVANSKGFSSNEKVGDLAGAAPVDRFAFISLLKQFCELRYDNSYDYGREIPYNKLN